MNVHYQQFAKQVFDAVDRQDVEEFVGAMTPDAGFTFANYPTVRGTAAIADYCRQFYQAIAGLRHDVQDVWHDGDAVVTRADVTYTRKDGTKVTVPCITLFRMADNRIHDYRVYVDMTPVFVPGQGGR